MANSILIKVNQIGTLTETLRGDRDGARGGLHGGDEPSLGRDRGRDDRRPGGGDRLRADQDGRAVALGQGGQVQPAAAHRGAAGPSARSSPGRGVFRRLRAAREFATRASARAGDWRLAAKAVWHARSRRALTHAARSARQCHAPTARARGGLLGAARAPGEACAGTGWAALRCCACWWRSSYLYLSAGVHMLSTWRQARHDSAAVAAMEREHSALARQHAALTPARHAGSGGTPAGHDAQERAAVRGQRAAQQLEDGSAPSRSGPHAALPRSHMCDRAVPAHAPPECSQPGPRC